MHKMPIQSLILGFAMPKPNKQQDLFNNYSSLDLEILPKELRKNGFDYKLVKRENNKCIYSQGRGDNVIGYEVFRTKIMPHKERMIKMKNTMGTKNDTDALKEFKESFPNDEEFGKRAWNYKTLESATKCYDGLI